MNRGGRWFQTQLVYKGASLQPLCAEVGDGPPDWFELVIPNHSPMAAIFFKGNLVHAGFPLTKAGSAQDPHMALGGRMGKGSIRCHTRGWGTRTCWGLSCANCKPRG